jgi:hypothetical protein
VHGAMQATGSSAFRATDQEIAGCRCPQLRARLQVGRAVRVSQPPRIRVSACVQRQNVVLLTYSSRSLWVGLGLHGRALCQHFTFEVWLPQVKYGYHK